MNRIPKIITFFLAAVCVAICLFLILTLLTGCQKTPEEPIVIGKDQEVMLEKAKKKEQPAAEGSVGENAQQSAQKQTGPLKDIVQAPERFDINKTEGKLVITADAPIIVPEGDQMNIMRVVPGSFSQEQVTALWDALVGDREMFYTSYDPTKSEIEESIIIAKQRLANAKNEAERRELENRIAVFEQEYPNAPDERIAEKTDSTLKEYYANNIYMGTTEKMPFLGVMGESADKSVSFTARETFTDINGFKNWAFLYYFNSGGEDEPMDAQPQIEVIDLSLTDTEIPHEAEGLSLRPQEAVTKVQELLDQVNIPFSPVEIELRYKSTSGRWYYALNCSRNVGDIPSAFIMGESYAERDGGWAETWPYETMTVTIDDTGVRGFTWEHPLEVTETVVDDSNLMNYADAQAIFEKMAEIKFGFMANDCDELTLHIDEVKLETMRILEQNKKEVGLLIPVWNFYGVRERGWGDKTEATGNILQLSVNAIDGSIIDTAKGY